MKKKEILKFLHDNYKLHWVEEDENEDGELEITAMHLKTFEELIGEIKEHKLKLQAQAKAFKKKIRENKACTVIDSGNHFIEDIKINGDLVLVDCEWSTVRNCIMRSLISS